MSNRCRVLKYSFLIFSGVMFKQVDGTDVWTDERVNEIKEVWLALYTNSNFIPE